MVIPVDFDFIYNVFLIFYFEFLRVFAVLLFVKQSSREFTNDSFAARVDTKHDLVLPPIPQTPSAPISRAPSAAVVPTRPHTALVVEGEGTFIAGSETPGSLALVRRASSKLTTPMRSSGNASAKSGCYDDGCSYNNRRCCCVRCYAHG